MFILSFMSRSKFVQKSFAPLRFADSRALASQVRAFFIRVSFLPNVKRVKLIKVENCLRRAGKRRTSGIQPARLSYLPSPRQRYACLSSRSVRFAVCPSARSVFLRVYRALVLYAAHSVHSQATCKRGIAHRIRSGCRHRGFGVAFRATIEQAPFVRRHRFVFCGSCTAPRKDKSRKHVRARALSRFTSQPAHVRAFNPCCMPSACIFFRAFKRPKSKAFHRFASSASKRSATLRALDSTL